jgi:hypothetical protein
MRSLSEVELARAVALLEDGRSMRFVANGLTRTHLLSADFGIGTK